MKPSISKFLPAVFAVLLFTACSDSSSPKQEAPAAAEKPTVQEPVQPVPAPKPAAEKPVVTAPTLTAQQLAERLKEWDKKLETLSTHFEQSTSYDGVLVSRSNGTLRYDHARNQLRLDTLNADGGLEQTAVTDKKEIIILDEKGQEVTTLSWADWQQGQPNQALFDFGNYTALVNRHNAAAESETAQDAVLVLTPKEGEEYKLYLTLSKKDYFPTAITIVSELMVTRADLSQTRKNEPLGENAFGGFFK